MHFHFLLSERQPEPLPPPRTHRVGCAARPGHSLRGQGPAQGQTQRCASLAHERCRIRPVLAIFGPNECADWPVRSERSWNANEQGALEATNRPQTATGAGRFPPTRSTDVSAWQAVSQWLTTAKIVVGQPAGFASRAAGLSFIADRQSVKCNFKPEPEAIAGDSSERLRVDACGRLTITTGRLARRLLEGPRKIGLAGKAERKRDVHQGPIATCGFVGLGVGIAR